jgi:lysophospholipase L1-like esterase
MAHEFRSYVAIGDSFTEGVGDDTPDGGVRGWADLVALGLALASPEPVTYANLAIRGRLLAPIVGPQLDAGIALHPELLSINGGGNDIMRPRVSIDAITGHLLAAVERAVDGGSHVLLVSGANPTRHIPLGSFVEARGNRFAQGIRDRLPIGNTTFVDNWADTELAELRYWSRDKLHLGPLGHERVAATCSPPSVWNCPTDGAAVRRACTTRSPPPPTGASMFCRGSAAGSPAVRRATTACRRSPPCSRSNCPVGIRNDYCISLRRTCTVMPTPLRRKEPRVFNPDNAIAFAVPAGFVGVFTA